MQQFKDPFLIEFASIGEPGLGYISIAEIEKQVPFDFKRVFWTYHTPESIVRGRHAHYETEQVLVAATGRIVVNTELASGRIDTFILDKPNVGVYIPPHAWHTMQYSHTAVQLVFASTVYNEKDYIRDHAQFLKHYKK
jgi:dTDP-4-dehydrorhamnose 3,5-epimerase-like enzyme